MADGHHATTSGGPERLTFRARAAVIAIALVAQAIAYWSAPLLFSNDGPQHLLQAWVTGHIDDPAIAVDWIANTPITSHGYNETFRVAERVLGWRNAHFFASWLPLAVALLGWLLLATKERAGVAVRVALLTGSSISWIHWIGLLPFLYGLACVPYAIMAMETMSWRRVPALALLLLVQCLCHPFTTMLTGTVLMVMSLPMGPIALVRTAIVGAPAASIALLVRLSDRGGAAGTTSWELESDVFRQFFGQYLPGPQGFRVLLFAFFIWSIGCWWRGWSSRTPTQRMIFVVALLLCLVTPVVPYTWLGWELVRARLIPVGLPLLIACAPGAALLIERWLAAPLAVALATTYLGWVSSTSRDLQHAYNDVYEPLARVLPGQTGHRWELAVFDMIASPDNIPEIDYYGGTGHMAQVLAVTAGGAPTFTQALDPSIHWIFYRHTPRVPLGGGEIDMGESLSLWGLYSGEPARRAIEIQGQLAHAYPYEVLIAAGNANDGDAIAAAGYDVTPLGRTPQGLALFEGRRQGCTVTFEIDAAVADVIEVGVLPRPGPVEAFSVDAGHTTTTFAELPCGMWWIRPGVAMTREPRAEVITPMTPPGGTIDLEHVVLD